MEEQKQHIIDIIFNPNEEMNEWFKQFKKNKGMEEQNIKTVETIQAEMIELHKKISESDEKIISYLKSMIQDLEEANDLQRQIIHLQNLQIIDLKANILWNI
jgi:uncharacterized protein YecA (UPF0149 family)